MSFFLGLDTSNYTTSAAVYDSVSGQVIQAKKLLPVKAGEKGLRQSDAVFHHTVQLREVLAELEIPELSGIGVSVRPRNVEKSYMPCFLCGANTAHIAGQLLHIPVYETSHQTGHILAALYSAKKLEWRKQNFLAFHVSGGTTDCVFCQPEPEQFRVACDPRSVFQVHRHENLFPAELACSEKLFCHITHHPVQ